MRYCVKRMESWETSKFNQVKENIPSGMECKIYNSANLTVT